MSQSIYTWGFGSDKVSPDGVAGAEPLRQSSRNPLPNHSSAASGAAQPPRPQGASFRRKREPRGAGERRKNLLHTVWILKKGVVIYYILLLFLFIVLSFNASLASSTPPYTTRARRAGRRSRRARRARASAGSASRAELEKGESWCKRHALKRGFGSDEAFPTGCRGSAPAAVKHKPSFVHSSAASGAAQPPRPQGASFRRKREPRGAGGRRKLV